MIPVGRAQLVPARLNGFSRSGGEQSRPPRQICMYTVYVLKDVNGKLYKGMTNNLGRRLLEHRSGKTITTSKMAAFELVYEEEFENKIDARNREVYFKTAAGRRFIKKKLNMGL